jgi:Tfp pilus assembly protein PilN
MLVEINLLPEREPRKFALVLILSSMLAIIILVGGVYVWQGQSVKNEITSLDRQITMTKKIANKENTNTETAATSSSINQLKNAIDWASNYPIQTIPVMRKLAALLPERGFIQNFGYTEAGTITLSVQFDSAREAAYFLNSLNDSNWIEEASLNSLTATAQSATTTTGTAVAGSTIDSSSQTNPTESQTNTNNTPNTTNTAPAATSPNTANTNPDGTAASTVAPANSDSVGQTNQTSSTNAESNPTSGNTGSASQETSLPDNQYLPRYTGQFEIKLNTEEVKKKIQTSKQDGEGVTGS